MHYSELVTGTTISDRLNADLVAKNMAYTHINQDLKEALSSQGLGLDEDWTCIGGVVSGCEKEFFNGFEKFMKAIGSKLSERYDVGKVREQMRNELKHVFKQQGVTDPFTGLP